MPASKAKIKANERYRAKTYEIIKVNSRREKRLNDLIKYAAQKRNISASAYIVMAIEQLLSYDDITISALDDLPRANENNSEDNELD